MRAPVKAPWHPSQLAQPGKRIAALVVLLSLIVVTGCTSDAKGSRRSDTLHFEGLRNIGAGVLIDEGLAGEPSASVAESVAHPMSDYAGAGLVFDIQLSEQPSIPARVALPTGSDALPAEDVIPLAFVADAPAGPWEPLVAELALDGKYVTTEAPHFSLFTSLLLPISAVTQEIESILNAATGNVFADAQQPKCSNEKGARDAGWEIDSEGPDTLKWCLGQPAAGPVALTVTNNRRYPVSLTHPGATELPRSTSALDIGNLAQYADRSRTVVMPRDSVTYTLDGQDARVTSAYDGAAQSLYALQTGTEVLVAIVGKFDKRNLDAGLDALVRPAFASFLQFGQCSAAMQASEGQAGTIIKNCFDRGLLEQAFGARGLLAYIIMTAGPVIAYFDSSVSAIRDIATGGDAYTITARRAKAASEPPLALGLGGAIGDLGLFAPSDEAVGYLTERLGAPSDHSATVMCETSGEPGERLRWGDLSILISDAPSDTELGVLPPNSVRGWYLTDDPGAASTDAYVVNPLTGATLRLGDAVENLISIFPDATPVNLSTGPGYEVFYGDYSNLVVATDGEVVSGISSGSTCGE